MNNIQNDYSVTIKDLEFKYRYGTVFAAEKYIIGIQKITVYKQVTISMNGDTGEPKYYFKHSIGNDERFSSEDVYHKTYKEKEIEVKINEYIRDNIVRFSKGEAKHMFNKFDKDGIMKLNINIPYGTTVGVIMFPDDSELKSPVVMDYEITFKK